MIATDLSNYLFARSTGHIGSLMTLINRGCTRAIRTDTEYLDEQLLDEVKTDTGADSRRAEFEAAFRSGTLTTTRRAPSSTNRAGRRTSPRTAASKRTQ